MFQIDPVSAMSSTTRQHMLTRPSRFILHRLDCLTAYHDQRRVLLAHAHGLVESTTLADVQPPSLLPARQDCPWVIPKLREQLLQDVRVKRNELPVAPAVP